MSRVWSETMSQAVHLHWEIAIFVHLGVGGVSELLSLDHGFRTQNTLYLCIYVIGTIGYDIWVSHYMGPYFAAYVSGKIGSLIYEV